MRYLTSLAWLLAEDDRCGQLTAESALAAQTSRKARSTLNAALRCARRDLTDVALPSLENASRSAQIRAGSLGIRSERNPELPFCRSQLASDQAWLARTAAERIGQDPPAGESPVPALRAALQRFPKDATTFLWAMVRCGEDRERIVADAPSHLRGPWLLELLEEHPGKDRSALLRSLLDRAAQPEARQAAARRLAQLPGSTEAELTSLARLMADGDDADCLFALEAVQNSGTWPDTLTGQYLGVLRHGSAPLQVAARRRLPEFFAQPGIDALGILKQLETADGEQVRLSVQALSGRGIRSVQAVQWLASHDHTDQPELELAVIEALAATTGAAQAAAAQSLLDILLGLENRREPVDSLKPGQHPIDRRERCIDGLLALGEAAQPAILECIRGHHGKRVVRQLLHRVLAAGGASAASWTAPLRDEASPGLTLQLAWARARYGLADEQDLQAVYAQLALYPDAVVALRAFGTQAADALPQLLGAVEPPWLPVDLPVTLALIAPKDPAVSAWLEEHIRDESAPDRFQSLLAVAFLDPAPHEIDRVLAKLVAGKTDLSGLARYVLAERNRTYPALVTEMEKMQGDRALLVLSMLNLDLARSLVTSPDYAQAVDKTLAYKPTLEGSTARYLAAGGCFEDLLPVYIALLSDTPQSCLQALNEIARMGPMAESWTPIILPYTLPLPPAAPA
ncbi:MAG: hypothetical protein R3F17_07770, partial [Planctomycetota bacterium]